MILGGKVKFTFCIIYILNLQLAAYGSPFSFHKLDNEKYISYPFSHAKKNNFKKILNTIKFYDSKKNRSFTDSISLVGAYLKEAKITGNEETFKKIKKMVLKLEKINSTSTELTYIKSEVLFFEHKFLPALKLLENNVSTQVNLKHEGLRFLIYQNLGRYKESKEIAQNLLIKNPSMTSHLYMAMYFQNIGQIDQAIHQLTKAFKKEDVSSESISSWARYLTAKLLVDFDGYKLAEKYLKSAIDISPYNSSHFALLAHIEYERKDYKKSVAYFQKAYSLRKSYPFSVDMALSLEESGEKGKARKIRRQVESQIRAELSKNNKQNYEELAHLLLSYESEEKKKEASFILEQCYKERKTNELKITLAHSYLLVNKLDKAKEVLENTLKVNSSIPGIFQLLSEVEARLGNKVKSKSYLAKSNSLKIKKS